MNLNNQGQLNPEILLQMAMESCMAKSVLSAGAGFALGGVFGTFMSSIDWNVNTEEYAKLNTRQQMRAALKDMGTKSWSTAKSFGKVGFLFSGTECIIESYRAKNDIYNGVLAGCSTGAILAASGGPTAMLWGCGGFAAFSAAIDYFLRHSDS